MINQFAECFKSKNDQFEQWYNAKLLKLNRCFYSSVDIRHSGYKLVPIDTNLFPAGFNNLNNQQLEQAAKLSTKYINGHFYNVKNILIIAEDHTRNLYYLDNIKSIETMLLLAGYNCKIASLNAVENKIYQGIINQNIEIHALSVKQQKLETTDGFSAEIILLNNDLSAGLPAKLQNLVQPIIPHPNNGWFKRRKSHHFAIYNQLINECNILFDIPKFNFTAEYAVVQDLDFKSQNSIEILANEAEIMLKKLKYQYLSNDISNDPYLIIKSDYGTYGMGIMVVKSAQDILKLNKKSRNQMHIVKNNIINKQVVIQEGIKTIDYIDGNPAEPMIYLIDHHPLAMLYRAHGIKDEYSNLNSTGMKINNPYQESNPYKIMCYFVAKIATLAAAMELQ